MRASWIVVQNASRIAEKFSRMTSKSKYCSKKTSIYDLLGVRCGNLGRMSDEGCYSAAVMLSQGSSPSHFSKISSYVPSCLTSSSAPFTASRRSSFPFSNANP